MKWLLVLCFPMVVLATASLSAKDYSARSKWEKLKLASPEYRVWLSTDGHSANAVFLSQDHDRLILRKHSGQEITLPYGVLDEDNKQYLSLLFWFDVYRTLFPTGEKSFHSNCAELNALFKERSLTLKIPLSESRPYPSLDRYSPGNKLFVLRTALNARSLKLAQEAYVTVSGSVFFEPGTCSLCSGSGMRRCPTCHGRGYAGTSVNKTVVGRNGSPVPVVSETRNRITCSACGGKGRLSCSHDDEFPLWKPSSETVNQIPGNAFCYYDYVDQHEYKRIYFCLKDMCVLVIAGGKTLHIVGSKHNDEPELSSLTMATAAKQPGESTQRETPPAESTADTKPATLAKSQNPAVAEKQPAPSESTADMKPATLAKGQNPAVAEKQPEPGATSGKAPPELSGLSKDKVTERLQQVATPSEPVHPESEPVRSEDVFSRIRKAKQNQIEETDVFGKDSGKHFRETSDDGLLVGFNLRTGKHGKGYRTIRVDAVQPIFLRSSGMRTGEWHGGAEIRLAEITVQAKDGYAVSGIQVTGQKDGGEFSGVKGIRIIFMRVKGDSLSIQDKYTSPWYGEAGEDNAPIGGANGKPVIGVKGTYSHKLMTGIGLVFLR